MAQAFAYDATSGLANLAESYGRDGWYLAQDGSHLVNQGSGGATVGYYAVYRLEGGSLALVEKVEYDDGVVTHTKADGTTEEGYMSGGTKDGLGIPYLDDIEAAYPIDESVAWTEL